MPEKKRTCLTDKEKLRIIENSRQPGFVVKICWKIKPLNCGLPLISRQFCPDEKIHYWGVPVYWFFDININILKYWYRYWYWFCFLGDIDLDIDIGIKKNIDLDIDLDLDFLGGKLLISILILKFVFGKILILILIQNLILSHLWYIPDSRVYCKVTAYIEDFPALPHCCCFIAQGNLELQSISAKHRK